MKKIFPHFWLSLLLSFVLMGQACTPKANHSAQNRLISFPEPARVSGQKDVLGLRVAPIDTVRIAFVGLGMRGIAAMHRFVHLEGIKVVALCDIRPELIDRAQQVLDSKGFPKAAAYSGEEGWKQLCEREDVDLVYNCTQWDLHVPISVYAMEKGKHVAIEVPAAMNIADCWKLVDTAERTRKHCMMLENCVYDFFEMATLNMAQQGVFGEVVHGEGAYIHDLRSWNFDTTQGGYYDMWRLKHNEKHNGNPYSTHGLGPICQIMNIHRGDKLDYLVSVSSGQFGMTAYAKEKFGADSDFAKRNYKKGDMSTTIIRTSKGKTIMIQHDVTSPRPYSRIHMVSGTKGFAQKWPMQGIALEPNAHDFVSKEQMEKLLAKYEHPFSKEIGEKARQVGGHGGMDFIMDYRLIHCLRNGLPLDMDVYDAAEWSCLAELTEKSVEMNGAPVAIPDFTRGAWNKVKGLQLAM